MGDDHDTSAGRGSSRKKRRSCGRKRARSRGRGLLSSWWTVGHHEEVNRWPEPETKLIRNRASHIFTSLPSGFQHKTRFARVIPSMTPSMTRLRSNHRPRMLLEPRGKKRSHVLPGQQSCNTCEFCQTPKLPIASRCVHMAKRLPVGVIHAPAQN